MAERTVKRPALASTGFSAPKPPIKIHPTAVIADKASIIGVHSISIGPNAVIHPYAKLSSQHGSIFIGEGCIISERSSIGLLEAVQERKSTERQHQRQGSEIPEADVVLRESVTVKPGAVVQASSVGKWSVVDINAKIEPGCMLGEHCKVNACITLPTDSQLPSYTVVYGPNNDMRSNDTLKHNEQVQQLQAKGHKQQIEVLRRLIPSSLTKWS